MNYTYFSYGHEVYFSARIRTQIAFWFFAISEQLFVNSGNPYWSRLEFRALQFYKNPFCLLPTTFNHWVPCRVLAYKNPPPSGHTLLLCSWRARDPSPQTTKFDFHGPRQTGSFFIIKSKKYLQTGIAEVTPCLILGQMSSFCLDRKH